MQKKKMGRPSKPASERVKYQHIAVHKADYDKLVEFLDENDIMLTAAFREMVDNYTK